MFNDVPELGEVNPNINVDCLFDMCAWKERIHILNTESMNTSHGNSAKLCNDL